MMKSSYRSACAGSAAARNADAKRMQTMRLRMSGRWDVEKAEEVLARGLADRLRGSAAQARDLLADVANESGLVALAAIRYRREVRAVGFDQHALERHATRNVLQLDRVLEGDDARERNVKPEVERALCDVPGLGEAVHDAADFVRALLAHDGERIGGSRSRV